MVGILRRRFNEIMLRKVHRVKIRWFEPLNKGELQKLGLTKEEKGVAL